MMTLFQADSSLDGRRSGRCTLLLRMMTTTILPTSSQHISPIQKNGMMSLKGENDEMHRL